MPYIGHTLSSEGVQADLGIVKAILEMMAPTDVVRVRRINIAYKKDTGMMLTDTLSRHHFDHTTDKAQGDEQVDSLETIKEILLCESTVATLRDHMLRDTELQQVQSFIQSDSPAAPKDLEPTISPNFHIDDE